MAGQGLEKLRAAGIAVECGLLEAEARQVIPGFIARMTRGRGRVRAKLAMSLDGRTAMASGESQWITGPAARQDVQRLRAMSCAVVTGVGTVLADDCALTVRAGELGLPPQPGELAAAAAAAAGGAGFLACKRRRSARVLAGGGAHAAVPRGGRRGASGAGRRTGPSCWPLTAGAQGLDLEQLMAELSARQCNEILVESGPRLAGALLQEGLLDELIVYMAPALLGDRARPLLDLPLDDMADKVQLQIEDVRKVGQDWRFTAMPA